MITINMQFFGGNGASSKNAGAKTAEVNETLRVISNPETKADYLTKLQVIAEMGQAGYDVDVSIKDWENYGKSRTYLKINAYRESDGKFHHAQDYGYYDNISGKYIKSQSHDLNKQLFTMSGAKPDETEIISAIRLLKKNV